MPRVFMILEMATSLCLIVASASLGSKLKDVSCQKQFRDVLLLFLLFWKRLDREKVNKLIVIVFSRLCVRSILSIL